MNANHKKDSERVIGCAYRVGNELGSGFLENVYDNALAVEMECDGLDFVRQAQLTVVYREIQVGHYVADFVVNDRLIIEIKALTQMTRQHEAQLLNYLKATGLTAGLLLNFGTPRVGVKRLVRTHDDANAV